MGAQMPRQVTQKWMDEHDFLMLVPEFLVRSTQKSPDELILELAMKDISQFDVLANMDTKIHGIPRSVIQYYEPYILPFKENPVRYKYLKEFIMKTVIEGNTSKKRVFNELNFSFEFDEDANIPELIGIPNIKYFRIVRLIEKGKTPQMEVPDPSFFG